MGKRKSDYRRNSNVDRDGSEGRNRWQRSRFAKRRKGPRGLDDHEFDDNLGYGMEDIGSEAWRYDSDEWEEFLGDESSFGETDWDPTPKRRRG